MSFLEMFAEKLPTRTRSTCVSFASAEHRDAHPYERNETCRTNPGEPTTATFAVESSMTLCEHLCARASNPSVLHVAGRVVKWDERNVPRVRANACSPHIDVTRPSFRARTRRCFTIAPHRMRYSLVPPHRSHTYRGSARADNARVAHVAHRPSLPTHSTDVGRVRDDGVRCARTFECCDDIEAAPMPSLEYSQCAARTVDTSAPLTPLPNSGRSNMGSRTRPRSSRSRRRTRPRPSSCRPQRSRLASSRLRVTFVEPTTVSRCRDSLHPHFARGVGVMRCAVPPRWIGVTMTCAASTSSRTRGANRLAAVEPRGAHHGWCVRVDRTRTRVSRARVRTNGERSDEHARAFVFDVDEDAVESPSFTERLSKVINAQDVVRAVCLVLLGSLLQRSSLSSIVLRLASIALVRFIFRRAYRVLCACCSFLYAEFAHLPKARASTRQR